MEGKKLQDGPRLGLLYQDSWRRGAACAGAFEKRPVSTRVNSVTNHDAPILNPVRFIPS